MGVQMTGRMTAAAYAKRDPRVCRSGPIVLQPSRMNDYTRPSLGQCRVNERRFTHRHRHSTILSCLKRWMAEIWRNIIRRVRHIFYQHADPCYPNKIPSQMDSALENAFWREGIQKTDQTQGSLISKASSGHGDQMNIHYLYRARSGSKCLSTEDSELETSRKSNNEYVPAGHKKLRYLPGRIESPLSLDEEYNALYEMKAFQPPGGACSEEIEKRGSLNRSGKKPSDSGTKAKSPMNRPEDVMDGEWVQTVCFGSVWFSRSELHTSVPDRQATVNRTRHTSRIPRLCCGTKKPLPQK